MNDWSHGYDVSVGYSYGFYREMGPDWLDLCAWIGGFEPPERSTGSFRYLELGSGQGFGLCLLAAANPQAEFVGVDFQPEHIEHSLRLAEAGGLANVRFVRADFLDLGSEWPEDFGIFDYVALHGILSWISPSLRQAVVQCLAQATAPGGLVYASYNAQPGCLSTMPLQHFATRLKEVTSAQGAAVVEEAIGLLDQLAIANAPVFHALPALKARLATLNSRDRAYLVHEYLTESWNIFWHSDVAREFKSAELDYIASATLANNLVAEFLPDPLFQIVEQQSESLRQDLQDFIINQAFRRDIFCRGARLRGASGNSRSKDEVPAYLTAFVQPERSLTLETSFGEIGWDPPIFRATIEALADGPKPLRELFQLPNFTEWMPRHILLLLLHANVLAPEAAQPGNVENAQRFNAVVAAAVCDGAPYDHLAAAQLGSAIRAADAELLLLDAWLKTDCDADVAKLTDELAQRLAKLGRNLDREGRVTDSDAVGEPRVFAATFVDETLPRWRQLGVIA